MSPLAVGIKALQIYFPKNYVSQTALEEFDGAGGKYTKGLGQLEMGFCYDNEDINSIALTVTAGLLENYNIDPNSVGFLSVGTETIVDKSKSVKTQLMELFGGNTDIEGVDVKNACFGGTQALFHAIDWVYANYETEKRLAIAVMADIAIYEPGPARCTGGAGAVAVLVGPDASIVIEKGYRGCHMANTPDFYKPIGGLASEYPTVNGSLSLESYLSAIDSCYSTYREKVKRISNEDRNIANFHSVLFHCPFYKLVQKAFARLLFIDYKNGNTEGLLDADRLDELKSLDMETTYHNRAFHKATLEASVDLLNKKVEPNMTLNRRIGNMYTPCLYAQLVTLISRVSDVQSLNEQRVLLFSYGSGLAATMFSLVFSAKSESDIEQLTAMQVVCQQAISRLDERVEHSAMDYNAVLAVREKLINAKVPCIPQASQNGIPQHLFPGSYYLTEISDTMVRSYDRTPC